MSPTDASESMLESTIVKASSIMPATSRAIPKIMIRTMQVMHD